MSMQWTAEQLRQTGELQDAQAAAVIELLLSQRGEDLPLPGDDAASLSDEFTPPRLGYLMLASGDEVEAASTDAMSDLIDKRARLNFAMNSVLEPYSTLVTRLTPSVATNTRSRWGIREGVPRTTDRRIQKAVRGLEITYDTALKYTQGKVVNTPTQFSVMIKSQSSGGESFLRLGLEEGEVRDINMRWSNYEVLRKLLQGTALEPVLADMWAGEGRIDNGSMLIKLNDLVGLELRNNWWIPYNSYTSYVSYVYDINSGKFHIHYNDNYLTKNPNVEQGQAIPIKGFTDILEATLGLIPTTGIKF